MTVRNVTQYLIQAFKNNGVETIQPNASVRFVTSLIDELPRSWHGLGRDELVKKIRETCELGASGGKLKRRRVKDVKGYVYDILV